MLEDRIKKIFEESITVISESKKISSDIKRAVDLVIECYNNGGKVIVFGNGGRAADAQHLTAELIGRFQLERQSLPAIALTTDTSIITSLGNDYSFDYIFARQCEALVEKNDVIIAISTSGKSKNVLRGISVSKKKGAHIIGLTGSKGANMKKLVDVLLMIPSISTARIQEGHRVTIHAICELVEENFRNTKK